MKNNDLLKRISSLGFPLFEVEENEDVHSILADVVKSKNLRLWEGFPVMLANGFEKGNFNIAEVNRYLKKPLEKSCFDTLMLLSFALYEFLNLKFLWAEEFLKSIAKERQKKLKTFLEKIKHGDDIMVAGHKISAQRLKDIFNNYFVQSRNKVNEFLSIKDELGLEYALSQFFTPKQKELLFKKLRREKLTKTEKEYYSRVIKKKVLALADIQLHNLAQKLLR